MTVDTTGLNPTTTGQIPNTSPADILSDTGQNKSKNPPDPDMINAWANMADSVFGNIPGIAGLFNKDARGDAVDIAQANAETAKYKALAAGANDGGKIMGVDKTTFFIGVAILVVIIIVLVMRKK